MFSAKQLTGVYPSNISSLVYERANVNHKGKERLTESVAKSLEGTTVDMQSQEFSNAHTLHEKHSRIQNSITNGKLLESFSKQSGPKIRNMLSMMSNMGGEITDSNRAFLMNNMMSVHENYFKMLNSNSAGRDSDDFIFYTNFPDDIAEVNIYKLPELFDKSMLSTFSNLKRVKSDAALLSEKSFNINSVKCEEKNITVDGVDIPMLSSDTLGGYIQRINNIKDIHGIDVNLSFTDTDIVLNASKNDETVIVTFPFTDIPLDNKHDIQLRINGSDLVIPKDSSLGNVLEILSDKVSDTRVKAKLVQSNDGVKIQFNKAAGNDNQEVYLIDSGRVFFKEMVSTIKNREEYLLNIDQKGLSKEMLFNKIDDGTLEDVSGNTIKFNRPINLSLINKFKDKKLGFLIQDTLPSDKKARRKNPDLTLSEEIRIIGKSINDLSGVFGSGQNSERAIGALGGIQNILKEENISKMRASHNQPTASIGSGMDRVNSINANGMMQSLFVNTSGEDVAGMFNMKLLQNRSLR